MSIAIVTDSGCDLPPGLDGELNFKSVPLLFRFGLEEYPDKSMPMQAFLRRVEQTWPTTSAPSPGDYIQAFRCCLGDHEGVVCITITSKHSASYSSAVLASQQFAPGQVSVVDSASLSIGQGLQVVAAARAALLGESPGQILARVKELQSRSHLYISLDTVRFLVKGGRASQLSAILAGLLQIRPVLTLADGKLTLLERPRGRNASRQKLLELAAGFFPAEFVTVGHVACEEEARQIASTLALQASVPSERISVVETGMAIATHGGPGTLGVVVVSQVGQS